MAVAIAAALPGPAAAAEVRADGIPATPALQGDGVVWAEPTAGGGLAVRSGAPGRAARTIQAIPAETDGYRHGLRPSVAASASRVLVSAHAFRQLTGMHSTEYPFSDDYAGPPAGPLGRLARCPGQPVAVRSIDAWGDAYVRRQCDDGSGHVEIRDEAASPMSPPRSVGRWGWFARIAGRYVAWLDGPYVSSYDFHDNNADVVVYDRVAGAEAYRIPRASMPGVIQSLDVQEDGKVAVSYDSEAGAQRTTAVVAWASVEEPRLHVLPLPARDSYSVALAGDRIGFQRGRTRGVYEVGVSDLAGRARLVDLRTDAGFDFDGARLAWPEVGCVARVVVIRDASATAAAERARVCRLRLSARPALEGTVVELEPTCGALEPPCSFDVKLRTAERGPDVAAGERRASGTVRIRLTKAAHRMLRARRSLRLTATAAVEDAALRRQTHRTTFRVAAR